MWSEDTMSYARSSVATGRAAHARQLKGRLEGIPWSSRLRVGCGADNSTSFRDRSWQNISISLYDILILTLLIFYPKICFCIFGLIIKKILIKKSSSHKKIKSNIWDFLEP